MSNPRVLPVQQSAGAITFTVLVEGLEVPDTLEFLNITTHKEVNKVPFARIILHDGRLQRRILRSVTKIHSYLERA